MKSLMAILFILSLGCFADEKEDALKKLAPTKSKISSFKEKSYKEIRASVKDLKNKKICYEATFINFSNEFPNYMERSGFRESKNYILLAGGKDLPVILKKTKYTTTLLAELKAGAKVKLYGRVKDFKADKNVKMAASYYLQFDYIEILSNGRERDKRADKTQGKKRPIRKRR